MTVMLVLFTLMLFLLIDHLVQKRHPLPSLRRTPRLFEVPEDVSLSRNHVWMRPNDDGTVTVGLDGFLSRLFGQVETLSLPDPGEVILPPLSSFGVGMGGKFLRVSSPVKGRVVEVNSGILKNPQWLLSDPYGKGWFVRVTSKADDRASRRRHLVPYPVEWMREQAALVRDFLAMNLEPGEPAMLQEGGLPVEGVLQQCSESVWREFGRAFVSLKPEEKSDSPEEPS